MNIEVLKVEKIQSFTSTNKPYDKLEVAYKNGEGKIASKTLMPFGDGKEVYNTMSRATPGSYFSVEQVKNAKGYWDWTSVARQDAAPPVAKTQAGAQISAANGSSNSRGFETPEERANKQVYIVRQSSISNAIEMLKSTNPSVEQVLQVAKEFEDYVFGNRQTLHDEYEDIPL